MHNQVTIMGRFVRDPELRRTNTGKAVASFTLAVDRDGEGCDFIPCVAWEKTGEHIANYFYKGKLALVTGRLQQRDWTDKDGRKRTTFDVLTTRIYFCDKKEESKPSVAELIAPVYEEDGELPW